MPRGPRLVCENGYFSITARGNNKRIIFKKEKDYRYFKNLLIRYKRLYETKIYHYCLMRNHIHLLVQIKRKISLAKMMHGLQLSYFHYYRKRYGYVGRFWQGRFYSNLIKDDKYLLTCGLYIERNPVRAKLVRTPEEYKWSSYNTYAFGVEDILINLDIYYLSLDKNNKKRQKIYRNLVSDYLNEKSGK